MAQIAKADPKEGVALLKKANIDVSEDDIKKVQAAVADSKVRPYTKIRSCLDFEV